MVSLAKALPTVPEVLLEHISLYLTLKDLTGWRGTSKQAFQDVETMAKKEWVNFSGLVRVPERSWFLNFLSQTYECSNCYTFDTGTSDAKTVQLCRFCFVKSEPEHVETCEACKLPFFIANGVLFIPYETFYCMRCISGRNDV